jgi:hypothetical protein
MRSHSYLNFGVLVFLFVLLAAAFPAGAGVIFSNPTGSCNGSGDSPDSPIGSAGGSPVNGGAGLTLWATCSLTSTVDGLNGMRIAWEADYTGTPPATVSALPLDWDFSIAGPANATFAYDLVATIAWHDSEGKTRLSKVYPLQGVTPPGGGTIRGDFVDFFDDSGQIFFFLFDLDVWSRQFQNGDTLTVTVPQHSSIDLNKPPNSVPESATMFPIFIGLGGAVLLSRRRARLRR